MDEFDVVVVGGGPGGYVAAIRAAQLGQNVALVEKDALGGLCLNWGCVPSKSLLRNAEIVSLFKRAKEFGITMDGFHADIGEAVKRSRRVADRLVKGVDFLMRKNDITVVKGTATFRDPHTLDVDSQTDPIRGKSIILATGARDRPLPTLPVDGETIITSRHALELREAPQRLVIAGGGPVGAEFASYFSTYGTKVTIVEMLPHILPAEDPEIADVLHKELEKSGIEILTNTRVEAVSKDGQGQATVKVSGNDGERDIPFDKLLVAIGFVGNTESLGLEKTGVALDRGWIKIDDHMETTVPGIYAVGDITGAPLLAHVAEAQGTVAAETIAGHNTQPLIYENMPRAVYSNPQVASIGLTDAEAKERGYTTNVGQFPYRANGKALALADYQGLVKIVSDTRTGAILGAQMVGPECSELLGEISLAISLEATPTEIGRSVHPHPSLSEALMEAALGTEGQSIHI